MSKSKLLRWLAALVVVAAGVTVVAMAGSVGPFSDRPHATPPPPTVQLPTPMSETNPAAAFDRAKGIYEGPLGDFLVTPRQASEYPPCPRPHKLTQNFRTSELYSPVFGEHLEVYECANGNIVNISVYDAAAVGRRYFVGSVKVPYEAPFDRLVLLSVVGNPAIAQLPMPAYPGSLRLTAIERFPSDFEPGILVWIDNTRLSLEDAAALAAQIMGSRP